MQTQTSLPYSNIFYPLLTTIHKGLAYCYSMREKELTEDDEVLIELFKPFEKLYRPGINKHITKGLSKNAWDKYKIYPRLSRLTIQAFRESQQITTSSNFAGHVLPSPLLILYQALIVPDEPQTAAYGLVLCRSMLFDFLSLHPLHPDIAQYEYLEAFEEKDVLESIASFRNYIKVQARWPDIRMKDTLTGRVNFLTGQFLSLKGYSYFWFSSEENLLEFCKIGEKINSDFIKEKYRNPVYRFRLSDNYVELPEPGELINSMFGIPLPIRGADVLFFGGLKKTAKGGSIINLNGKPGAGKTSVCLSIAAMLSPLNTKCIYISLEEQREDLYTRLITLIPEYLKELSIYKNPKGIDKTDWFIPYRINENLGFKEITEILNLLHRDIKASSPEPQEGQKVIPAVCPLLIVLDNINELASGYNDSKEGYKEIEEFIYACRQLGALVMLISAEELVQKLNIDYLVDTAINIKQRGTDDPLAKPVRIFQLNKTRHQISRQGSHVFHLSAPTGFRICPQIPSQMDKKENMKRLLPDKTRCIHTLNFVNQSFRYFLQLFPISQILIHGVGSSGKAGFALKLLLSPPVEIPEILNKLKNKNEAMHNMHYISQFEKKSFYLQKYQTKVLVVSFLYPEEYYTTLVSEKMSDLRFSYKGMRKPKIKILPFYPGYLAVEDFISKIIRHLDESILEGEPYTGILLDGLHNVFLQFKNLQDNDMMWPLLYGILSRYKLTVVSTFTNFSVNNHHDAGADFTSVTDDQRIMLKGQAPFLHSLVKASDFYLTLDEKIDSVGARRYIISVRSSIDQRPPSEVLEWDRQSLRITHRDTLSSILSNNSLGN